MLNLSSRRRGFTLIEMLVVCGVIALIGGIVLAVYARAREKGRQTMCVSNLRQIGTASLAYAQDYDGYLPPFRNTSEIDAAEHSDGTSGYCAPDLWYASLRSYIRNDAVLFCPSDPVAGQAVNRWVVFHKYSSYYYNARVGLRLRDDGFQFGNVRIEPSEYALVSDANYNYLLPPTPPPFTGPEPTPGCEHFHGVNAWFLDGHVKWDKPRR